VVLHDGDTISLGDATVFKVSISNASCPAAAPAAAAPAAAAARAAAGACVPTVESFLNAQCEATCARFQVRACALTAAVDAGCTRALWCCVLTVRTRRQQEQLSDAVRTLRADTDAAIAELQAEA
jgi:hypothetical protein